MCYLVFWLYYDLRRFCREQEKTQFELEAENIRRRLRAAERESVASKEECMQLSDAANAGQREVGLLVLYNMSSLRTGVRVVEWNH